ncbi:GNAT family N-acetyltransferase [Paenibacillus sp. XY044]|uniref:GNAT family N-acetyltransferase n=1 Tax=Paenibacillus sp. XY044 TaxID=2026089 RepID=UPI000B99B0E8|nr:GNAT family N-acetyltransferase [Paenibacillus sp. XY044]OZB96154.1 GNAT family N-acetyltransferase [Paenibacillus sp. XY044]
MIIREASKIDYPQLRQIYLESRRKSFHWANAEEMNLNDFDRDTTEEYILLAEEDSRILGFASLYLPDRFIHNLFVHPDFSGKGVGTQLVKNAIEKMGTPVRLKCVSENHKALSFYEKSGWKKVVEEGKPGERYWVLIYE